MEKFTLKQLEKAIKDTKKCTKSNNSDVYFYLEGKNEDDEIDLELVDILHFHVVPDIIFRFKKSGRNCVA